MSFSGYTDPEFNKSAKNSQWVGSPWLKDMNHNRSTNNVIHPHQINVDNSKTSASNDERNHNRNDQITNDKPENLWKPVGIPNIANQTENSFKQSEQKSNESHTNSSFNTNKDDILSHYSIRELDPEWREIKEERQNQSNKFFNDSIDQTHTFHSNIMGFQNKSRPDIDSISQRDTKSTPKYPLYPIVHSNFKQNNWQDKFKIEDLPLVASHMKMRNTVKQVVPNDANTIHQPTSINMELNSRYIPQTSSIHHIINENDRNLNLQDTNHLQLSNEVIKNPPPNISIHSRTSQMFPIMNDPSNVITSVTNTNEVKLENKVIGNVHGTSSHINSFTSNIFNVPPPPIPQSLKPEDSCLHNNDGCDNSLSYTRNQ